jgi:hypothetical protein
LGNETQEDSAVASNEEDHSESTLSHNNSPLSEKGGVAGFQPHDTGSAPISEGLHKITIHANEKASRTQAVIVIGPPG